jgi:hypothetical protein
MNGNNSSGLAKPSERKIMAETACMVDGFGFR